MIGRNTIIMLASFAEYEVFCSNEFAIARKQNPDGTHRYVLGAERVIELGDTDSLEELSSLIKSVINNGIPF